MTQMQIKQELKHSPTLNTVLMVENVLKGVGEPITIAELKRRLPRKVMIGTKGILWIYTESKLRELINKGLEV